jgi:hypothetical protein
LFLVNKLYHFFKISSQNSGYCKRNFTPQQFKLRTFKFKKDCITFDDHTSVDNTFVHNSFADNIVVDNTFVDNTFVSDQQVNILLSDDSIDLLRSFLTVQFKLSSALLLLYELELCGEN